MPIPPVLPEPVYGTFAQIQDGSIASALPPSVSSPALKMYFNGQWYLLASASVELTVSSDAIIAGLEQSINSLATSVQALQAQVDALSAAVIQLQEALDGLSVALTDGVGVRTAAVVYTDGVYGDQVIASRDYPIS